MRIEIVVDVPNATANSLDVIRYGNELARLVRNDAGVDASLVHAALGSAEDIVVTSDFIDTTIRAGEAVAEETHAYADHVTPHNEERDDNVQTPYNVDAPVEAEPEDDHAAQVKKARELYDQMIATFNSHAFAIEVREARHEEHESDEQKDAAPAPEQER